MKKSMVALSLFALLTLAASTAGAQPAPATLLDASQPIRDNLLRLKQADTQVELVLKNDKSYRGKLGGVGDHAVVVTDIAGREFFIALVLIDEIAAVEIRAPGK
jgi:hypothetical protein